MWWSSHSSLLRLSKRHEHRWTRKHGKGGRRLQQGVLYPLLIGLPAALSFPTSCIITPPAARCPSPFLPGLPERPFVWTGCGSTDACWTEIMTTAGGLAGRPVGVECETGARYFHGESLVHHHILSRQSTARGSLVCESSEWAVRSVL